jgi:hypothetical protein
MMYARRMSEGAGKGWSAKVSSLLLFVAVAAAPLPFGSANPPAMSFWCIVLGVGLITATPCALDLRHVLLLGLLGVVIVAYAFVLHEQLAERPWIAAMHPLWRQASEALGVPLVSSVSIARNESFFALGSPLICVLALTCGFMVGTDRDRARKLLYVIAWSGAAFAAYGIAAHLIDPTKVLWRDKTAYMSSVTSTFINRNTAAVYFGSCSVVCLTLLCGRVRQLLPHESLAWREVPIRILLNIRGEILLLFAMLFVSLATMFMTGSRAGVLLSLMALVIAFTMYFYRELPSRGGVGAAALGGGRWL